MKCFVLWGVTLATVLCSSRAATFTTQFSDSRNMVCNQQDGEFYSSVNYTCSACNASAHQVLDTRSGVDVNGNYASCRCQIGYLSVTAPCVDGSGDCSELSCTTCPTTSTSDNSACVGCGNSTMGVGASGDCACDFSAGEVLRERDEMTGALLANKTCGICPTGTRVVTRTQKIAGLNYTADLYSCQQCPDEHMSMTRSVTGEMRCTCAAGYLQVGDTRVGAESCVLTSKGQAFFNNERLASTIDYDNGLRVDSLTFRQYYVKAATECMFFGSAEDMQQCQILANLCVLNMYDNAAESCTYFTSIIEGRSQFTRGLTTWGNGMPWIQYEEDSAPCLDTSVQMKMDFDNLKLEYAIFKYSLNGTFLGSEEVDTFFSYCTRNAPNSHKGGGTGTSTQWTIFGSTEYLKFSCDLNSLLELEQVFYELYLLDTATSLLTPIPIRIINAVRDDGRPNGFITSGNLCSGGGLHARRFFLADTVSGLSEDSFVTLPYSPTVMRYASHIILDVRIQKDDPTKIYTPVLTIEYSEVSWVDMDGNDISSEVKFDARYSMDTSDYDGYYKDFWNAGIAFWCMHAVWSLKIWRDRNNRADRQIEVVTFEFLMTFCSICMRSWTIIWFPWIVLLSFYWFLFFKLQSVVSVLLPPSDSDFYDDFIFSVNLLFIFQLIHVLHTMYAQASADVFFVDWEPMSKSRSQGGNGSVSCWRTILVANEWTEMLTLRRTNLPFSLLFIGFFLLGLGLENNATQQPDLDDLDDGPLNVILRFSNVCWWWFVMSAGQIWWKFFIYERYITEPPEQVFVDLCTIAKISIFVLDEEYHGYYLHCRSPHQYADGSMGELVSMLHKEEVGHTTDRSLQGAPPNVQSFEIFVTCEFRKHYNGIRNVLSPPQNDELFSGRGFLGTNLGARRGARGGMGGTQRDPPERLMKAWHDMNQFIQGVVENTFSDVPDLKRQIITPTYLQSLLNIPPDLFNSGRANIFYPSESFSYIRVLAIGRELDLVLLNVISYCVFDLWFNNTMTSLLLCYLLDTLIMKLREYFGQQTISKHTLVDERFLI